jgi:hypothetical protein
VTVAVRTATAFARSVLLDRAAVHVVAVVVVAAVNAVAAPPAKKKRNNRESGRRGGLVVEHARNEPSSEPEAPRLPGHKPNKSPRLPASLLARAAARVTFV